MPTQSELKWLEEREHRLHWSGVYSNPCLSGAWKIFLVPDYKDAAEFEARVAELLTGALYLTPCNTCLYSTEKISCRTCRLKYARIEAEYLLERE